MEIKDKPTSMSVREWITKKIAIGNVIPEKVIKQVIAHQFDSAHEALSSNNSLEISGFGKFYYNEKKADKEIKWCEEQKVTYERIVEEEVAEGKRIQAREKLGQVEVKLAKLLKKKKDSSDGES